MMRKGVICYLKKDNKVLLIQVVYNGNLYWNGVSGFVDENESEEVAVIREIKEEIGIDTDPDSLKFKGIQKISPDLELDVYTADKWRGDPRPMEDGIKQVKWFEVDNLPTEEMLPGNKEWAPQIINS